MNGELEREGGGEGGRERTREREGKGEQREASPEHLAVFSKTRARTVDGTRESGKHSPNLVHNSSKEVRSRKSGDGEGTWES